MDDLTLLCPECGNTQPGRIGELRAPDGTLSRYECDDCLTQFKPPSAGDATVPLEDRVLTLVCGNPDPDEARKEAESGLAGCGQFMARRSAVVSTGGIICPRCYRAEWPFRLRLYGPDYPWSAVAKLDQRDPSDLFGA